jgi:hypothetical protein
MVVQNGAEHLEEMFVSTSQVEYISGFAIYNISQHSVTGRRKAVVAPADTFESKCFT